VVKTPRIVELSGVHIVKCGDHSSAVCLIEHSGKASLQAERKFGFCSILTSTRLFAMMPTGPAERRGFERICTIEQNKNFVQLSGGKQPIWAAQRRIAAAASRA
jgi:hypothetical protein